MDLPLYSNDFTPPQMQEMIAEVNPAFKEANMRLVLSDRGVEVRRGDGVYYSGEGKWDGFIKLTKVRATWLGHEAGHALGLTHADAEYEEDGSATLMGTEGTEEDEFDGDVHLQMRFSEVSLLKLRRLLAARVMPGIQALLLN